MNKKETLEIRKQFTNENCAITRICGCYVDAEKQIRTLASTRSRMMLSTSRPT